MVSTHQSGFYESHRYLCTLYPAVGRKALCENGINIFNKVASDTYKMLSSDERAKLKDLSSRSKKSTTMTPKQIKSRASQIFSKIQKQVHIIGIYICIILFNIIIV